MTKIMVLGASGMLGSMVLDYFSRDTSINTSGTIRNEKKIQTLNQQFPDISWSVLNAEQDDIEAISATIYDVDWVINAIGIIKPYIHDDNPAETERATRVNALFPHKLARAAQQTGTRVLQIATDCVFSGNKGNYVETDSHDALDVYGKSKSLGEVTSDNMYHLRCSIIGPEPKQHVSLLDWFLGQKNNSTVNGYTNHSWNGVTTLHYAKLCKGIIQQNIALPHVQHVLPSGTIIKEQLLHCFRQEYKREDVTINPVEANIVIDRTIATNDDASNQQIWKSAGYDTPASIPQMIKEMSQWDCRFTGIFD